jgi:hypothetical protein
LHCSLMLIANYDALVIEVISLFVKISKSRPGDSSCSAELVTP